MQMIEQKNPLAVALGKLAKGVKKTGLTRAEIKRRSNLAKANLKKIHAKQ
jgi:uncharacterized protein YnzC (UPF0291/DUF896 family)